MCVTRERVCVTRERVCVMRESVFVCVSYSKFKFKSQTQKFRPETNTLDMRKHVAQKLSLEKTDT